MLAKRLSDGDYWWCSAVTKPADTASVMAELISTEADYRRNHSGWSAATSEFWFTLARRRQAPARIRRALLTVCFPPDSDC